MKKKKKILIVFWDLGLGGIQHRIKDISKGFSGEEHKITILLKHKAVHEYMLPRSPHVTVFYYPWKSKSKLLFFYWLIRKTINVNPDILLGFMYKCGTLVVILGWIMRMFRRKVKVLISEEILPSVDIRFKKEWYGRFFIVTFYRYANAIIVLTKTMKKDLVKNFQVPKSKIMVISSWTSPASIKTIKKNIDFLFVGRLAKEKGIEVLLRLAKVIQRKKLSHKIVIVGEGPLYSWINTELNTNSLKSIVSLVGYRSKPEIYYQKARLLLLPSKNEGLPLVVLEANMHALPVIALKYEGIEECIKNRINGYICKSENAFIIKALYCTRMEKTTELRTTSLQFAKKMYPLSNLNKYISFCLFKYK